MNTPSSKSWIDLYRNNPIKAWDTFLQRYNRLIMAVIGEFLEEHDRAMDLYTYSLENMKKNGCKRLVSYFDKPRRYSFESWIAIVVRHCCLDQFRKEKGQKRLLKCIKTMPPIDQWIFRYVYWYGYAPDITHELLTTNHGFEISFDEFGDHLNRIRDTLKQSTRWNIERGWQANIHSQTLDADKTGSADDLFSMFSEQNPQSSEEKLIHNESQKIFNKVLLSLPPEDQLIIHLRFTRGLTLEEIARLLRIKNIWRINRKLTKAITVLRKKLRDKDINPSDL